MIPTSRKLRSLLCLILPAAVQASFSQTPPATPPATVPAKPVYIMLKLDDLTSKSPGWVRTVEFLKEKNVKSSIGIICNSLEKDNQAYFDWIKSVQAGGLVEFWNHGYDHKEWTEGETKLQEFKGPSYEQQKEHFSKSQQLAKDKLGITLRSFGAPFNATDANTVKVLSEDPDVKVFLYGNPRDAATLPKVMILDRTQMNIENPLFVPNARRIEQDYDILAKKRDDFVIQGHANQWDGKRFEEFKKLVEFLISKGATFVTPYEYYLLKTGGGKNPPPAPAAAPVSAASRRPSPRSRTGSMRASRPENCPPPNPHAIARFNIRKD